MDGACSAHVRNKGAYMVLGGKPENLDINVKILEP
jgi:hypothetical protein